MPGMPVDMGQKLENDRLISVMIIDDDEFVSEVVSATFDYNSNTRILKCSTASESLDMFFSEMPDIIIMDMGLPDMSGLDLIRHLKNEEGTCHIPIVVISGSHDLAKKKSAYSAGASAYVTKPFFPDNLRDTVMQVLNAN